MENTFTISEISVTYQPKKADRPIISTAHEAMTIARKFFPEDNIHLHERFIAIYLNRSNRVILIFRANKSTLSASKKTGKVKSLI